MTFRLGDEVDWMGARGVVDGVQQDIMNVRFKDSTGEHRSQCFFIDGKMYSWHTEPYLKLINRPKKMEKRSAGGWINIYVGGIDEYFSSREMAESYAARSSLKCLATVFLSGEYEVEVE